LKIGLESLCVLGTVKILANIFGYKSPATFYAVYFASFPQYRSSELSITSTFLNHLLIGYFILSLHLQVSREAWKISVYPCSSLRLQGKKTIQQHPQSKKKE